MEAYVGTLLLAVGIFTARVVDVTLGTLRTINIVHGRTKAAFMLGFVEISIWLLVITTVIQKIQAQPFLGLFYAFGFSTGNVVGIMIERRLAIGATILRIVSAKPGSRLAEEIRTAGFAVTEFQGEGLSGPVKQLYVVCRRRDLKSILSVVRRIEPDAFYITEHAGDVSRIYRPMMPPPTGWRAIFKKK
jgi:uncharacterized protein YebE (UPF0316 family)